MTQLGALEAEAGRAARDAAFDAPWQVRAFAILLALQRSGLLERMQWAQAFGEELARHEKACPGQDDYHANLLRTLHDRVCATGLCDPARIAAYQQAWGRAVARTPHGSPIELAPEDLHTSHHSRETQ